MEIESQCRGFLDVARLATEKLVEAIFGEAAFLELFHKLHHSREWEEGDTTASILATANDYFHDYEKFIDPSNFKRWALSIFARAQGCPFDEDKIPGIKCGGSFGNEYTELSPESNFQPMQGCTSS